MTTRLSLPDLLASVPHMLGYKPGSNTVVAAAISGRGGVQFVAALNFNPPTSTEETVLSDQDVATHGLISVRQAATQTQPDRYVVVGYGPHGADRSLLIAAELAHTTSCRCIHVDQDHWSAFDPSAQRWTDVQQLPEVPVEVTVVEELADPTATREELAERYEPCSRPTYEAIPQDQADRLNECPPSLRVQIATRALDNLATPGHADTAHHRGRVAHILAASPLSVRDAIASHAASSSQATTTALVEVYRGAPVELQSPAAAAAVGAMWLQKGSGPAVDTMLECVDQESADAGLVGLLTRPESRGIDPKPLKELLASWTDQTLETADEEWSQDRVQNLRDASFPRGVDLAGHHQADNSPTTPHPRYTTDRSSSLDPGPSR